MIAPTDLRIGNYINWIVPFSNDYAPRKVDIKVLEILSKDTEIAQPIPLTEDILLKCDFKKTYYGFEHINNYFQISQILDDYFVFSVNSDEYHVGVPFQYLHQLQNLYFALTGQELQVIL